MNLNQIAKTRELNPVPSSSTSRRESLLPETRAGSTYPPRTGINEEDVGAAEPVTLCYHISGDARWVSFPAERSSTPVMLDIHDFIETKSHLTWQTSRKTYQPDGKQYRGVSISS